MPSDVNSKVLLASIGFAYRAWGGIDYDESGKQQYAAVIMPHALEDASWSSTVRSS
jgi:hypothetical protein